jgi:hypothetical protein
MKRNIRFLCIVALILFVFSACSSNVTAPSESQPTAELPQIETTAPNTSNPPLPAQTTPLFTESGGDYQVNLTPDDFVEGVDNPYFPLPPGAKWEFEIRQGGVTVQTDTLEVLRETRDVNGVQAMVVRDTVSSGNEIVEDTYDWFAQDKYGNVWYVGESVDNYVGGALSGHAGSWEWGIDGALPGIIMWADPSAHIAEDYHQEYFPGKAEDMGRVLGVNESLSVPFGSFDRVVKTLDFSNIETAREQKFYAPGMGLIKEMDVNGHEEVVLVNFTKPAP